MAINLHKNHRASLSGEGTDEEINWQMISKNDIINK